MTRKELKEYIINHIDNQNHDQITFDYLYYKTGGGEVSNCFTIFVDKDKRDNTYSYKICYTDMNQYQQYYDNIDFSANDEGFKPELDNLTYMLENDHFSKQRLFHHNELDKLVAFIYYNFKDIETRKPLIKKQSSVTTEHKIIKY